MNTAPAIGVLLFFLAGTFFLTAASSAFRRIRRRNSRDDLKELSDNFLYHRFQRLFFPDSKIEGLLFALFCAQTITRVCLGISMVFATARMNVVPFDVDTGEILTYSVFAWARGFVVLLFVVSGSVFVGDFLPRTWTTRHSRQALSWTAPAASIYLLLFFPLTYVFLRYSGATNSKASGEGGREPISQVREKIIEIIEDASTESESDVSEKELIESAIEFSDRVVREIMTPRVDMFALSGRTTVREAAQLLSDRGFSRTPIFKGNVDTVVGILMAKDLFDVYREFEAEPDNKEILNRPIEELAKQVLFTPETKKISDLLQELRRRQTHMAVVVDEYGGTEGIVTIEDILEEIVGEIADEYDVEETLFTAQPGGGWIVDARMSILDIEEKLGVDMPQDGEYDTIGGYAFHRAGTIPAEGMVIHHDDFELEVLSSSDRCVEKVRITPVDPIDHTLSDDESGG